MVEPSRPCTRSFSPSLSQMNSPKYTTFTRWQETAVTDRRRGTQALSLYLPLMRSVCFPGWIFLYTFYPSLCKELTLKLNLPEAYGSPADICGIPSSPWSNHYEYSCSSTGASSYICLHHYTSKLFKSRTPPAPRTSSIKFTSPINWKMNEDRVPTPPSIGTVFKLYRALKLAGAYV